MTTDDKRFQDALHNLTTAFFNFLDVVNPGGPNRENDIRYIAQTLQNLAAHMGSMPAQPTFTNATNESPQEPTPQTNAHSADREPTSPTNAYSAYKEPTPPTTTLFPDKANFFREYPSLDRRSNTFVFDRLRPDDGQTKIFRFYINRDTREGEFDMKNFDQNNWLTIYENKDRIFPSQVVILDGDIVPNAKCETVEKGQVRCDANGHNWIIVKPCTVKITAL